MSCPYLVRWLFNDLVVERVFDVDDEVDQISPDNTFWLITKSVDFRMQVIEVAEKAPLEDEEEVRSWS